MRNLYKQHECPILLNKLHDIFQEIINCTKGEMNLIEDNVSGLIYNYNIKGL